VVPVNAVDGAEVSAIAEKSDAWPAERLPGSEVEVMRVPLLDPFGVDITVLNPPQELGFGAQAPTLAAALTKVVNDWTADSWLDADDRLRGGITCAWLELLDEPALASITHGNAAVQYHLEPNA
jgi:predicted TIM-barrel fold metal-dependent hydrolase